MIDSLDNAVREAILHYQKEGKLPTDPNIIKSILDDYLATETALKQSITEKIIAERSNEELYEKLVKAEEAGITDGLTGLKNHNFFMNTLEEQISLAERERNYLSVVMLDIDHFKEFNDTYGHLKGDNVLVMTSRLIMHSIRAGDIAARYGGEEFGLILPYSNEKSAKEITQRVLNNVAEAVIPFETTGKQQKVTLSAGLITYHKKYEGALELLALHKDFTGKSKTQILIDLADRALYLAKNNGRNQLKIGGYMMQNGNHNSS